MSCFVPCAILGTLAQLRETRCCVVFGAAGSIHYISIFCIFFFRFHIQHSPFHASRSALYTLHFKALHRPPTAPHFKLRLPLSTLPPHFTPRASHSKPYLPCSLPPRSTIHAQLATLPAQHSTLPIPHFSLHALRSTRPASHSTFCTPRSHSTRHASRPHFILRALGSTRTPRAPHSALRALRSALHP